MKRKKGKYFTHVEPKLEEIKHWCREGLTEHEIAKRLGISRPTLATYKGQYDELQQVLIEGKALADYRVEDSLYKRALGYEVDETTRERKFNDETGEYETVITKIVSKELPADTSSMIWWLKNRSPEKWRDKQEISIDGNLDVENKYRHMTDEEIEAEAERLKKVLGNE